jgi:Tfp pilus assembly protein PilE
MNLKHGMTLVEVMIIVATVGLIVALLLPIFADRESKKMMAAYQLEKNCGIASSQTNVTHQVTLTKANGLKIYNIREVREYSVVMTNNNESAR